MPPAVRLLLSFSLLAMAATAVELLMLSLAMHKLGLSQGAAYLLMAMTLAGSMIDLPLFHLARVPSSGAPTAGPRAPAPSVAGGKAIRHQVVAMNVGGALIPLAFSAYLLLNNPIAPWPLLGVVALVAALSFCCSSPVCAIGIGLPVFVAPMAAVLLSLFFSEHAAAPLAYIGATAGVLIGAELMRLGPMRRLGAPLISIGGGGSMDGVFLAGLFAVLLS